MSDLAILFFVLFLVVMIGVVVVVVVSVRRRERKRTRQLQGVASQLGWSFTEQTTLDFIPGFDRFALFNQGHTRYIKNLMYGGASGIKTGVFDYIYVTGYGKDRRSYAQSVVYLEPGNLRIPYFSLRPEGFFHKIISAFGYQDIDFGQRPNFSGQYILRGTDEQAIRNTFNDGLLSFFENYARTCTDGGGNQLFVYRSGERLEPHRIQSYVGFALSLLKLLPRTY